jgi:DNA-binding LacI/PurR family transcriptional regulator
MAEETRQHIRQVARRMGYRPNRNAEFLKRGQNPVIGCFLPSRTDSLLAKLMKGIAEEAEKNNFPLAFYFDMTKNSYLEFIQLSQRSKNCGIITYPYFKMDSEVEEVIINYKQNGGKIVLIEGASSRWQWRNCTSVSVDNYHGGKLAAHHLLKRNTRSFLVQDYDYLPERCQGFIETLENANKEVRIIDTIDRLLHIIRTLTEFPAGVFLPREQDAVRMICELERNNIIVGQDVFVIGYDDHYLSQYTSPSLTTVSQPFVEVGHLAAQKLIDEIYENPSSSSLVKPELIIRNSA